MHESVFFRLFPPPKLLTMPHAGLDISDDAIHLLQYVRRSHGLEIGSYERIALPPGIMEGGDIKDPSALGKILSDLARKHRLFHVKVSIPEEKSYLFQTDVPGNSIRDIRQNIEFKIEQNVPLAAQDAVFYFDLLPSLPARASVSVASRAYVEQYVDLLHAAGMQPVAFEVVPKAVARAILAPEAAGAKLIIHVMERKTGIYIVSAGVVCFTSTVAWGPASPVADLSKEIERVYSYWASRDDARAGMISEILLVGRGAEGLEEPLRSSMGTSIFIHVADAWSTAFSLDRYVPPISRDDSLEYAVAAGLAFF